MPAGCLPGAPLHCTTCWLTRHPSPLCPQSLKSPQKPQLGGGEGEEGLAAVIHDGLELYARELQQINTRRPAASQPVAAGSGGGGGHAVGSLGGGPGRPPRAPGAGKKSNFYPASLPKGGHSQSRSRPFGQSPPSVAVGWLLGSSPGNDGSLLGRSPGSRHASPRHGSLMGRCVQAGVGGAALPAVCAGCWPGARACLEGGSDCCRC